MNAARDQPILESADRVIQEMQAFKSADLFDIAIRKAFRGH